MVLTKADAPSTPRAKALNLLTRIRESIDSFTPGNGVLHSNMVEAIESVLDELAGQVSDAYQALIELPPE